MRKKWGDMNEGERKIEMRRLLKETHFENQKRRNMTMNPKGDESFFVGCNEVCNFPHETKYDFVVQHDLGGEEYLYFCGNPKAERFLDKTLKLCMGYGARQSDEGMSEVEKGNVRVRGERG